MNKKLTGLLTASALLLTCPAPAAEPLLIENVTLVSPELARPLGNRQVLIRDGRIAAMSDRAITAPAGTRRLDGSGKFLTPGLTDAHVHVSDATGLPFLSENPQHNAMREQFFKQQPRSYLYFGVTQLLDPSNMAERVAQFAAQPQHPDIYRCGAAPVVDGYPILFLDKAIRHKVFNDWIYEPANAARHPLPEGANAADHTPEAVVERIAASGAICVKVFLEDGFGMVNDWPMMSADTLRRVRAAAKKRGLFVAAHANAVDAQRMAIDGNVDLLVHGIWNWNQLQGEQGIPPGIADHLRRVRDRKIGYQATLRVLPGVSDLLNPTLLDDPVYPKVVPPSLLAWYRTDEAQWFKREVYGPTPNAAAILAGERAANARWATSESGMRALRYLYEIGQPMLLGSDTPSSPTYGNQPGYDTYKEMQLMARAGIPLSAIFAAGTINNARQLGLDKDYGSIEKGKVANLLLLDANPLASLEAWTKIDKIILHGEPIDRETLAADLPGSVVISDVTVLSPERAAPLEHAHLRLRDGKIVELSDQPLRGETEIDGKGRFLIPGLIDSHVHLALPPGFPSPMNAGQAAANPKLVAAALDQDPKSFLFFGFTTVIDLVSTGERARQWNARDLRPDAHFCGAAMFVNNQLRRVLYPYFSYGLSFEQRMVPITDPAQTKPDNVVDAIKADGAICVKTVQEELVPATLAQMKSLVAAARDGNLPLLIHANRKKSQAFAVAADVDIIVHGMWRSPGEPAELDQQARDVLAKVIKDGIGYQPTTQVIAGYVDMHRPEYLSQPQLADAYPAALLDFYRSPDGNAGVPEWIKNAGPGAIPHATDTLRSATEVTRILSQADARLLFGSDTPSDWIWSNPAGLNGRTEMNHWIAAGVSLKKLFSALTLDNARAFHLEDKIGTVEVGKNANLLLLGANPLESVQAYDSIETVFLHGKPIPRAELSARRAAN